MIVFPAIDIKEGKCVRLTQGDFSRETVYSTDPVKQALYFKREGAKYLHVVDLDGAKEGVLKNIEIVVDIKRETGLYVQCGGGMRDFETAKKLIDAGIDCVIVGSAFFTRRGEVERMLKEFSQEKVALSLDFRKDKIKISGWQESVEIGIDHSVKEAERIGIKKIIFTDISRDGTLEGPNLDAAKRLREIFHGVLIASGGIKNEEDVMKLKQIGIDGVIIGKALYSKDIILSDLLKKI